MFYTLHTPIDASSYYIMFSNNTRICLIMFWLGYYSYMCIAFYIHLVIPAKDKASSQTKFGSPSPPRGVDALLGAETAEKTPTAEPKKV